MSQNWKSEVILVDIDGTLADCSHRRHHLEKDKKDWPAFFAAISDDKPNEWCVRLSKMMHLTGTFVVLVTGRHENLREKTIEWLKRHGIEFERLYMRPDGDYRQDAIVKEEILKMHIEPNYRVLFAVDDRKQVVDMWRRNGIVCLQCDEGAF